MNNTKQRIDLATRNLFGRFGYNGTSLKQITGLAGVTVGSVYHFFPGGKSELAADVICGSGEAYRRRIEAVMDAESDLPSSIRAVFEQAADALEASNFDDICPIGGIAREVADSDPELRSACQKVFEDWIASASIRFRAAGIEDSLASDLAMTFISSLEGNFILARTFRSKKPLMAASRSLCSLVKMSI